MTPEENAQRIADLETRLLGRGNAHLALVQTSIAAQAEGKNLTLDTVRNTNG